MLPQGRIIVGVAQPAQVDHQIGLGRQAIAVAERHDAQVRPPAAPLDQVRHALPELRQPKRSGIDHLVRHASACVRLAALLPQGIGQALAPVKGMHPACLAVTAEERGFISFKKHVRQGPISRQLWQGFFALDGGCRPADSNTGHALSLQQQGPDRGRHGVAGLKPQIGQGGERGVAACARKAGDEDEAFLSHGFRACSRRAFPAVLPQAGRR